MWSHAKDVHFDNADQLRAWARSLITVEIHWQGNFCSMMKTMSTKDCQLCAKERCTLWRQMNCKKVRTAEVSGNLMNSRTELHGACNCKTRFLRLKSRLDQGADETAGRSKTSTQGGKRDGKLV